MSSRIIVVVQENGNTQGGVNEFGQIQDAERFIEDLLAVGIERQSIRVLAVQNLSLVITRKPVVSLVRTDWMSRLRLPTPETSARSKSGLVSVEWTPNSQPGNRLSDVEPLWAPTGDGADVTVEVRALPAISLN